MLSTGLSSLVLDDIVYIFCKAQRINPGATGVSFERPKWSSSLKQHVSSNVITANNLITKITKGVSSVFHHEMLEGSLNQCFVFPSAFLCITSGVFPYEAGSY